VTLVWLADLRLNVGLFGPEEAPPVILIHGLGLDLRLWEGLLPALARNRVLALDLRGHGLSDTPPAPYALGGLIRDVERLADHFNLRDAVVVGQGEGGLIAQGLAVKRLDMVRGLVLTGTATRLGNPDLWAARIARHREHGPDIDMDLAALLGPRWKALTTADPVRAMLEDTRPAGWRGVAAAMATADLYQTTATLTLPTLVLAGGEDRKVPPDMQRETADLIAGAEFRLLPGAPHLAMLSDPARFGELLQDFLTRIGHG
jgi:3-oxoadipate enol-lactonase